MITVEDLREAIAECQGERNPNAQTCIKLAAYYTIMDNLERESAPTYSRKAGPSLPLPQGGAGGAISYEGNSEFANAIQGRDMSEVWPIIDELMATLEALYPKLYNVVMRRISG